MRRSRDRRITTSTNIAADTEKIRADLKKLSTLDHARSASTRRPEGNELVPPIAAEFGLKVTVGAWIDKDADRNKREIEAATPIWWLTVADTPRAARWCPPAERDFIERSLAAEAAGEPKTSPFRRIFAEPVVWQLVLVSFLIQIGFYGLNMWLPTLLKAVTEAGFGAVGLIAALPYCTAIVFMWVNGWLTDRNRRYQRHVLMPLALAAVSLVASVLIGQSWVALSVFFICLAMGGALAYEGPFWAAASRAVPVSAAGAAAGLINAVGNLGGFLEPRLAGSLMEMSRRSIRHDSPGACRLASGSGPVHADDPLASRHRGG